MTVELEFNQEWALFFLTIPGSRLWLTERAGRMLAAVDAEIRAAKGVVMHRLRMPSAAFDDFVPDVVDKIFHRFHVVKNSLYDFKPAFIVSWFRAVRTTEFRRPVGSFPEGDPLPDSNTKSDEVIDGLVDLGRHFGWSRDDCAAVAQVMYEDDDADEDWRLSRLHLRQPRRNLVNVAGKWSNQWDRNQQALNLYLQGKNQTEVARCLGASLACVNHRLQDATSIVAGRTGGDPKSLQRFAQTWSKCLRSSKRRGGGGLGGAAVPLPPGAPEPPSRIAWHDPRRWEQFFQIILTSFPKKSWQQALIRRVPVLPLAELVAFAGEPRLKEVLTAVHDRAMDIFAAAAEARADAVRERERG